MNKLHWEILDEPRKSILMVLRNVSEGFYLAGGTALALQLGHRDSIDFDFFSQNEFQTEKMLGKVNSGFLGHKVVKTQDEKWTLSVLVDDVIKISFFTHKYQMVKPLVTNEYFDLASIEDIACMKMLAVTTRSVAKDYVDMYFILHLLDLKSLIDLLNKKYPLLDRNLVLKSLVFFDDMVDNPIMFKNNNELPFDKVKVFLRETVVDLEKII